MSRKTKGWLIAGVIALALFAPATFMMLVDRGIDAVFMLFNQGAESLSNLPTPKPVP